ncbi:uncharacterized protein LOC132703947 isoform X3 [Cylas formicarius]|uniref:uncharacterized protein LOC132703947 isoform X3 n=1 Tax=Cylas formicarius TaxID=197179 RepID=UPI002958D136|nr:uncharacterized protein LOC132703947 isoform X3 [Cylas formicarius]
MVMSETLKRYPARSWKIVGSDASACLAEGNAPLRKKKYNFDDVIAIMWEPTSPNDSDGFAGLRTLGASKRIALWTSAPPSTEKVTFDSAMDWASRVGKAAKNGYQVIYRQLTTQELAYSDTPVYWFTVLHKRLMGNHVLEVKSRAGPALSIYCHCAKRQDEFARSGAVTIMAINNGTEDIDLHVVLGTIFAEKSMEVQTYTLTAAADAPTLTVEEVEDVLKRRAQAKAAERRVKLTDAELDALVRKATITLPRKVEIKRDINRALLEEKASFYRYNTFSQEALERLGNAGKSGRLPRDFKVKRDINLDLLKRRSGNRDLADPFKVKRRTTTTTKPAPSRWFDSDDLDVDSEVGSSPDDLFAELLETSSVDEEVQVPKRRPIAKKIVSDESGDGRLQYLSASGELGPCIGQFFGKQPCSSIFDYARRKRDRPENALDAGIKSTRYDGPFGRYEPISARFRPWRPADILYLKRDFNTFPLTNGKFKGGRRWERDVDSAENEIDHGTDHRNYIVKVPAGGAHHVQKVGAAGRRASFEGVIGTIFREIWSKLAELVSKLW